MFSVQVAFLNGIFLVLSLCHSWVSVSSLSPRHLTQNNEREFASSQESVKAHRNSLRCKMDRSSAWQEKYVTEWSGIYRYVMELISASTVFKNQTPASWTWSGDSIEATRFNLPSNREFLPKPSQLGDIRPVCSLPVMGRVALLVAPLHYWALLICWEALLT